MPEMAVPPAVNETNDMNNATIGYLSPTQGIRIRWGVWKTHSQVQRGTVLLLAGRGEYLEKYHETATDLIKRGFDVYSFDWRGQGLSSRMLPNRQKGFVRTYDDYLVDLDAFIQTIMLPSASTDTPCFNLFISCSPPVGSLPVLCEGGVQVTRTPTYKPVSCLNRIVNHRSRNETRFLK